MSSDVQEEKLTAMFDFTKLKMPVQVLLCLVAGVACSDNENHLSGEWSLQLYVEEADSSYVSDGAVATAQGAMVFSREISFYRRRSDPRDSSNLQLGRAYIRLGDLFGGEIARESSFFYQDQGADLAEEALANTDSSGIVRISVSPAPSGLDLYFVGRLVGDSIAGDWSYVSHADTIFRGRFSMSRTRRSAFTDSALVRSQRAAEVWQQQRLRVREH